MEISHFFDFQREEFHKLQQLQEGILMNYEEEVDNDNKDISKESTINEEIKEDVNEDEVHESITNEHSIKEYYSNENVGEFSHQNSIYDYNIFQDE